MNRPVTMCGICTECMRYQSYIQDEDLKDREKYGFPKRKIIYDVKCLLRAVECAIGRENKINAARDTFAYLATTDGKKFIRHYTRLEKRIKEKLLEFRHKEELREAQRWWRDIFETRIPIE